MKIAITTTGKDLNGELDSRFGRAEGFLIVDTSDNSFEYFDNVKNLQAAQGAGIQTAQNVINAKAGAVITGHTGPKAFSVLKQGGVLIYHSKSAKVSEVLEEYNSGKMKPVDSADVEEHW